MLSSNGSFLEDVLIVVLILYAGTCQASAGTAKSGTSAPHTFSASAKASGEEKEKEKSYTGSISARLLAAAPCTLNRSNEEVGKSLRDVFELREMCACREVSSGNRSEAGKERFSRNCSKKKRLADIPNPLHLPAERESEHFYGFL